MFENVYLNPNAKGEEDKAVHMIEQLLNIMPNIQKSFPGFLRRLWKIRMMRKNRSSVINIAGMTDSYAVKKFQDYFVPEAWKI